MSNDLAQLRKFTSSIRKSNSKSEIFKIHKCRLQCENDTRWSSAILNLCSVLKAYNRIGKTNGNFIK